MKIFLRCFFVFFAFFLCVSCTPSDTSIDSGEQSVEGLGAFTQHKAADCFFLISLLALESDADGRSLVRSAIQEIPEEGDWKVVFPNQADESIVVTREELSQYRLLDITAAFPVGLVSGDPDVRVLEIAADKLWKRQGIKPQGLWDDVPMNALFMFSNASQRLIWNRSQASMDAIRDVDK